MRYEQINSNLFQKNRKKLITKLDPQGIALFCSNDVLPTNADGIMGFRQNNDLFYLTGIDQEDTYLLIFPDHPDENLREVLFIRETNEHLRIWEGEKLSKKEAESISGIKQIYWSSQLDSFLERHLPEAEIIYLNSNESNPLKDGYLAKNERFNHSIRQKFSLHPIKRLAPILANLRLIKEDIEVELIKKAISISEKAFRRVLKSVKPGIYEFELEAELTHEFLMNRSRGHAFQPIVASGSNACILHYISNNEPIKDGDLILIDFGAEYANYNADITRVIPANGRFSPRQKEVYDAVLDILFFATELLRSGNNLLDVKKEIISFIASLLHKIGLGENFGKDDNEKLVQKYFPHGISHPLGLDVHDVGSRYISFQAGMIFTCEPGIYIEKEAFGIRLENDILITEKGPMNLAAKIPLLAEEIEELMNSA